MSTDFRTEAAKATQWKLTSVGARSVADLTESGCVFFAGGRGLRYAVEGPSLTISIACFLSVLLAGLFGVLGVFSERQALALTMGSFAIALVYRKVRSMILRRVLTLRRHSLIRDFPELPARAVAIEDATTVQKIKFLTEDEGLCLLDSKRRRLLIEGCSFQHVIYGTDVSSVEAVSGYALSGARLLCRMGGQQIDMVIKSAGQGPLASLVQAFAPSLQAAGLLTVLNRTLFGADVPAEKQNPLPPAIAAWCLRCEGKR